MRPDPRKLFHFSPLLPNGSKERQLMMQRREDLSDEQRKKDLGNFRDVQLERAIDALKGVLVYAQKTGQ